MTTDQGRLYMLRPARAQTDVPTDLPDSDLMGLAQSLSFANRRKSMATPRPSVIVIASDPSRYQTSEFASIDVNWVVLDTPVEALDHLLNRGDTCAAVLTEIELQGKDNGYRVVEALRACGYEGPILVVASREPLVSERALVKRRGATGIVVFRSERMVHMLHAVAAGVVSGLASGLDPTTPPRPHSYPTWIPGVIKRLTHFIGPTAGEVVRKRFVGLYARQRALPQRMDLVDEAADVLSEWPEDKARFIASCKAMKAGAV